MKSVAAQVKAMTADQRALRRLQLKASVPHDQALLAELNRADKRDRRNAKKANQQRGAGDERNAT